MGGFDTFGETNIAYRRTQLMVTGTELMFLQRNHFGRYLQIVSSRPVLVIRNALLSLGQVFSVGYIVKSPFLSLLSSISGFFVLLFLLLRKQFVWVVAILSSALAFFWYFPPIPAYNFAAYLLLVCGLLSALRPASQA